MSDQTDKRTNGPTLHSFVRRSFSSLLSEEEDDEHDDNLSAIMASAASNDTRGGHQRQQQGTSRFGISTVIVVLWLSLGWRQRQPLSAFSSSSLRPRSRPRG